MGNWKDEDIATPEFIKEYLKEFKSGIDCNSQFLLKDDERVKVENSLVATEQFCMELLATRKSKLYMHDLILMAVGFYGGYLTAMDVKSRGAKPKNLN